MVSKQTLESPLDCKEIQPVHPKGGQSWVFIERTDAEAESPILWPPDAKNWLIWKAPDAGKDWRWEEKGMTKDEMVGWHRWLNGHEFEWTPVVGDGQGSLACCGPWGRKELDTTERLNWTEDLVIWPRTLTSKADECKLTRDGFCLFYSVICSPFPPYKLTVKNKNKTTRRVRMERSEPSASSFTDFISFRCFGFPQNVFLDELKGRWWKSTALSGECQELFQEEWAHRASRYWPGPTHPFWASLVVQAVKNLPAMQETWVRSLSWEDPLEKTMATHSSILAWRIPWTVEPGRLQGYSPWGCKELDMMEQLVCTRAHTQKSFPLIFTSEPSLSLLKLVTNTDPQGVTPSIKARHQAWLIAISNRIFQFRSKSS